MEERAMKRQLAIALRFTLVTTILLGIGYPLLVTALSQALWRQKANGELIRQDGRLVGSHWIGQPFSGDAYFHGRPSAAGNGYDATASGGSNWSPSNEKLTERVAAAVKAEQADGAVGPVPVDLVTASGSGLDPDITPFAAEFQAARVARARHAEMGQVMALIAQNTQEREFGLLGERRVNVLELNLALDRAFPLSSADQR